MNAQDNHWFIDDALTHNQSLIQGLITNEIGQAENVDTAGAEQSEGTRCYPESPLEVGCGSTSARIAHGASGSSVAGGEGPEPVPVRGRKAPTVTALGRPRPNPGEHGTRIELAVAGGPQRFRVDVYDVGGRRVANLVDGVLPAGRYELVWPGRDEAGRTVAAGVYFVRAVGPDYSRVEKVVILK